MRCSNSLVILAIVSTLFSCFPINGESTTPEEWTWGAEINFVHRDLGFFFSDEIWWLYNLVPKLKGYLLARRIPCELTVTSDSKGPLYEFKFENGLVVGVGVDSQTLEVKFGAATRAVFEKSQWIGDHLFRFFKSNHFVADHAENNCLHLNAGYESIFRNNPPLFRNFQVDLVDHPELGSGAWGSCVVNAPLLADLGNRQRDAFTNLIYEFDQGRVTTSDQFAFHMNNNVYTSTVFLPRLGLFPAPWNNRYFQALGMKTVLDKRLPRDQWRLELRAFRGPSNFEEVIDMIRLVEKRLIYLNRLPKPVPLSGFPQLRNAQDGVNRYYKYVTESGLNYEHYRKYLPYSWKRLTPGSKVPLIGLQPCVRSLARMRVRLSRALDF